MRPKKSTMFDGPVVAALVLFGVGLILIGFVLYGMVQDKNGIRREDEGAAPASVIDVDIAETVRRFRDYDMAASAAYGKRWLRVTGRVGTVRQEGWNVELDFGQILFGLDCYCQNSEQQKLRGLAKGQTVVVTGICTTERGGFTLRNALISFPAPPAAPTPAPTAPGPVPVPQPNPPLAVTPTPSLPPLTPTGRTFEDDLYRDWRLLRWEMEGVTQKTEPGVVWRFAEDKLTWVVPGSKEPSGHKIRMYDRSIGKVFSIVNKDTNEAVFMGMCNISYETTRYNITGNESKHSMILGVRLNDAKFGFPGDMLTAGHPGAMLFELEPNK